MDMACPQCGNPKLDVDAQNSVVFCKQCGFAVQVDPQTGNVTPLSQGSVPQSGEAQAPPVYQNSGMIFGLDKLTFFLGGSLALLAGVYMLNLDLTLAFAGAAVLAFMYFRA